MTEEGKGRVPTENPSASGNAEEGATAADPAASKVEFLATGRTGRRNAVPDIIEDSPDAVSALSDAMAKVSTSGEFNRTYYLEPIDHFLWYRCHNCNFCPVFLIGRTDQSLDFDEIYCFLNRKRICIQKIS
jgi:hypothetical protein